MEKVTRNSKQRHSRNHLPKIQPRGVRLLFATKMVSSVRKPTKERDRRWEMIWQGGPTKRA
jgi:hypothetical protein